MELWGRYGKEIFGFNVRWSEKIPLVRLARRFLYGNHLLFKSSRLDPMSDNYCRVLDSF